MGVLLFYFLVYFELFRRRIRVKPLGTPASVYVRALPFSVHRVRGRNGNFISRMGRCNVRESRWHEKSTCRRITRKHFLKWNVDVFNLWTEKGAANNFLSPPAQSHSHAHVLIIATAPVCVCASFVCVLSMCANVGPMCVKSRTLCCLQWCLWQCQSVIVPSLWSSTELFSINPAMYLTGVIGAGISRCVLWVPPVVNGNSER